MVVGASQYFVGQAFALLQPNTHHPYPLGDKDLPQPGAECHRPGQGERTVAAGRVVDCHLGLDLNPCDIKLLLRTDEYTQKEVSFSPTFPSSLYPVGVETGMDYGVKMGKGN